MRLKSILNQHFVLAFVLFITALVYTKIIVYGHISWDDPEMVFKNPFVKHFDIKALFSRHFVGNYIPVTMLAHSLIWQIFGDVAAGHHLLNVLLHLLNGILIYRLSTRLFKNESIALFGSLIFLLHPLQIESVAWISELKNVLSTTFYLTALISYTSYLENSNEKYYIYTLLFFTLGLLSKPSVVVFPFALISIELMRTSTFSLISLLNKIPFFVMSFVIGMVTIKTQSADLFINHAHEFPIYQRIGYAGFALLKYVLLFLFPVNLSVIYPYPTATWFTFGIGFFVVLILTHITIWIIFKKQWYLFGILLFISANLILVLQLLPFGEVLYADRYAYVPILGFSWLIGIFFTKINAAGKPVLLVFAVLLAFVSISHIRVWKSALILYEDILKKYPDQFIALNSAGVECMFLNKDDKALEYFNHAVKVAPNNYKSYYNKGLLYLKNKKAKSAIQSFNQTIAMYEYAKAYAARASAYYLLGDLPKAMSDANHALKLEGTNSKARFILGNCYNDMDQLDDALKEFNQCIALNAEDADYYFKRAIVFGKQQSFQNCLTDLELCTAINPNYFEAYYWKGVAKVNLKQDACADFKKAAQQNFEPAISAYNKYCR